MPAPVLDKPKVSVELAAAVRAAAHCESDPQVRDPDYLAERFLGLKWRLLTSPLLRKVVRALTEKRVPGMYWFSVARTKHGDAALEAALADPQGALPQLVILGAAYDSRALRFRDRLRSTRVFEVDLPPTVRLKQERWRSLFGEPPAEVCFVGLDLNQHPIEPRLEEHGYDPARRSLFLFEGTSMFLPRTTIEEVLRLVARSPGATLAMDFFSRRAIEGKAPELAGAHTAVKIADGNGEPLKFGLEPEEVRPFFCSFG